MLLQSPRYESLIERDAVPDIVKWHFCGVEKLLGILPDLCRVGAEGEPEADEV